MYTEASLDPERCIYKSNQNARNTWVANHIRQLGHFEDVSSPNIHTQEEDMEDDINMGDTCQGDPHALTIELPLGGSGVPPTGATVESTTAAGTHA